VMPAVIGHAIDDGIAARDVDGLLRWTLTLLGIGLVQAFAGIMRHRFAVTNWLTAAYRTVQLVARQASRSRWPGWCSRTRTRWCSTRRPR